MVLAPTLRGPGEAWDIRTIQGSVARPAGHGQAQPVDEEVHRLAGRGRRVLAPEGVDHLLDGDDLVRVQGEQGQQGARGRAADLDELAGGPDLDRAEQAVLDQTPSPLSTRVLALVAGRLDRSGC